MIVKMYYADPDPRRTMVECDVIQQNNGDNYLRLCMSKNGKIVKEIEFVDSVRIYITEMGKTVDTIDFNYTPPQSHIKGPPAEEIVEKEIREFGRE